MTNPKALSVEEIQDSIARDIDKTDFDFWKEEGEITIFLSGLSGRFSQYPKNKRNAEAIKERLQLWEKSLSTKVKFTFIDDPDKASWVFGFTREDEGVTKKDDQYTARLHFDPTIDSQFLAKIDTMIAQLFGLKPFLDPQTQQPPTAEFLKLHKIDLSSVLARDLSSYTEDNYPQGPGLHDVVILRSLLGGTVYNSKETLREAIDLKSTVKESYADDHQYWDGNPAIVLTNDGQNLDDIVDFERTLRTPRGKPVGSQEISPQSYVFSFRARPVERGQSNDDAKNINLTVQGMELETDKKYALVTSELPSVYYTNIKTDVEISTDLVYSDDKPYEGKPIIFDLRQESNGDPFFNAGEKPKVKFAQGLSVNLLATNNQRPYCYVADQEAIRNSSITITLSDKFDFNTDLKIVDPDSDQLNGVRVIDCPIVTEENGQKSVVFETVSPWGDKKTDDGSFKFGEKLPVLTKDIFALTGKDSFSVPVRIQDQYGAHTTTLTFVAPQK